jgi:hypothetical protein
MSSLTYLQRRIPKKQIYYTEKPVCSICLDDITDKDKKNINIKCSNNHLIHDTCMNKWLTKTKTYCCPSGCAELLVFNYKQMLLDQITNKRIKKDLNYCNKSILELDNELVQIKEILGQISELYKLYDDKYIEIQDKIKGNPDYIINGVEITPYSFIIVRIEYIKELYNSFILALYNLKHIKHNISIFTSDKLEKIIVHRKLLLDEINKTRKDLLHSLTYSELENLENIINVKTNNFDSKETYTSIRSKIRGEIINSILKLIISTIPILKQAINPNILDYRAEYVPLSKISSILSYHHILNVFIQLENI